MPRGYPKSGERAGCTIKRFYTGMSRTCSRGHEYVVTESMSRRGSYKCPTCDSRRAVEYARQHRDKKRASNNAYHARMSPDKRNAITAAYRARHPDRKTAHQSVQTAIRNGTLVKSVCVVCGNPKTHGHHDDYTKPLEVKWLCHAHHMELHALAQREKGKP